MIEQVGHGGMAVVFRADDERLRRVVALKLLAPALAADDQFRQRFIRESRAAAAVDDPHIIPVYEAGEADGVLFIAMRFVSGGDVHSLLRRSGPLTAARAMAIVSPVASALDAAHSGGLVHRDVKPANMLLDSRPGRPDHVYLSDFGLSKWALSATGLTASGQFMGTPDYVSPEQVAGRQADGRADQYSLACVVYEMLTGQPPFQRDSGLAVMYAHASEPPPPLAARRPDLPAADEVLWRALAKTPGNRYLTCRDFAEALRRATGLAPYDPEIGEAGHAGAAGMPAAARTPTALAHDPAPWRAGDGPAAALAGDRQKVGDGAATIFPPGAGPSTRGLAGGPPAQSPAPAGGRAYSGQVASGPARHADLPGGGAADAVRRPRRRRTALIAGATAAVVAIAAAVVGIELLGAGSGHAGGGTPAGGALSPATYSIHGVIYTLDSGSAGTAWAAGSQCTASCGTSRQADRALILRWNGSGWTKTPASVPGDGYVYGIASGRGKSAWAVGYSCVRACGRSGEVDSPFALRWDGTAWSRSPLPDTGNGYLSGVISEPDGTAWAVGTGSSRTVLLHYSAGRWTRHPSPDVSSHQGQNNALSEIVAGPGGTAWAVGTECAPQCSELIMHLRGGHWSQVRAPSSTNSWLSYAATGQAGDAWAGGHACSGTNSGCASQILRWNGSRWRRTPVPGARSYSVLGLAETAPDNAWAIASACAGPATGSSSCRYQRTYLLHWDGHSWRRAQYPGDGSTTLFGLTAGAKRVWLTGTTCSVRCTLVPRSEGKAVIYYWDGKRWQA